jgi:hypothetical protein
MACDATTLAALAAANGLSGLCEHDLMVCLASIYGQAAMYANAQVAVNAAAAAGMAKLSEADLWKCLEAAICV